MEYLLFLQKLRESCPAFVNNIFVFISEILVSMVILVPSLVYWCGNKKIGQWMLLNYSGAYMVNQIVKNSVCLYRPWIREPRLHIAKEAVKSATGYSFPSGHTTLATTTMESLAVWQRKRKWVVVLCSVFIFLVAFARNWLGAHTQYDVITAIFETSVVIIVNIFLCRYFENKTGKSWLLLIIGLVVITAVMLYLQFKPYPMDYDVQGNLICDPYKMLTDCYTGAGLFSGFLIGWFLEKQFVHFSDSDEKKVRILRGVIGAVVLGVLYLGILPLVLKFMEEHLQHFVKYFILMLYITLIYPLCFKAVEQRKNKNK